MRKVRTGNFPFVFGPCSSSNQSLGKWIAEEDASIIPVALEDIESRLEGSEKVSFLDFLRTMLRWLPEERKTAKELLQDPWLQI